MRASLFGFFVALLLLAACAPPQPGVRPTPDSAAADPVADYLARGEVEMAAALLERQARSAAAEERPQLLLRAAELRLNLDQPVQAQQLLAQVSETLLPSPARYHKALLEIRLLLAEGQTGAAENRLSLLPPPAAELRPAWLRTQAEAARAAERPFDAAKALVELDALLPDPQQQEQNQRAIWTVLSEIPMEQLRSLMPPAPDQFGAWLELAYLTRSYRLDPDSLRSALLQWQQRYPEHPADQALIEELIAYYQDSTRPPERIAVLLPLSGNLGEAGTAVFDGIMAAYYADHTDKPQVKVYDIGDDPSRALAAYQEAVAAGSDFVVGPLTKESLMMLVSIGELPAPVLALNTLPGAEQPLAGMYQFALAPEDEAMAAADYAIAQGLSRALVLVPDGDWGARVATAFGEALTRRGGMVLETVGYDAQGTDFSAAITALLNLDASQQRGRRLRGVVRRDLKLEPQRRQDVDMVFVGAFPRAARLIRPQLRFFDAIDVPVITTSHAYGGAADPADQDLNGMQIVDMPWLLHPDQRHALNRQELQQLRPAASQHPRLYAFGIDAYDLVRHLPFLHQQPADTMEGQTGVLSIDEQGRVHRRLYPARFRGGVIATDADASRSFGYLPDHDAVR